MEIDFSDGHCFGLPIPGKLKTQNSPEKPDFSTSSFIDFYNTFSLIFDLTSSDSLLMAVCNISDNIKSSFCFESSTTF